MSSPLRFPLLQIKVRGGVAVRAYLPLQLRRRKIRPTDPDSFTDELRFQVDSAADVTMMSLAEAEQVGIQVPDESFEQRINTAGGRLATRVRTGMLIARIPGLEGELFLWPCHFWEMWPPELPPVLGTAGVVNAPKRLRLTMDGSPMGGNLIVEVLRGPS
jgi:Aspartyl protease